MLKVLNITLNTTLKVVCWLLHIWLLLILCEGTHPPSPPPKHTPSFLSPRKADSQHLLPLRKIWRTNRISRHPEKTSETVTIQSDYRSLHSLQKPLKHFCTNTPHSTRGLSKYSEKILEYCLNSTASAFWHASEVMAALWASCTVGTAFTPNTQRHEAAKEVLFLSPLPVFSYEVNGRFSWPECSFPQHSLRKSVKARSGMSFGRCNKAGATESNCMS